MDEFAIKVENLNFSYDNHFQALKNINISIKKNEFVGIIGQNGAGKSTLLKNITGLLKPTSGDIYVLGANTKDISVANLATKVGFVLQNPDRQIFSSTVYDEVSFGPKNLKLNQTEIAERVDYALNAVGMSDKRDQFPPALSKGDRAKVIIASVLAMRPEIIILDEPTSGQDYLGCYQIMDIAKEFHQQGYTIIVVTHHMALVAEYAERTIVFCEGKILMDDTSRNVFSHPDELRETFITPPQITQLGFDLKEKYSVNKTILNVREMGNEIINYFSLRTG